jgi:hypothetical protein
MRINFIFGVFMPVYIMPDLSVDQIKAIGDNYQPGFLFWHKPVHTAIALALRNYSENDDDPKTFKQRWTYLIDYYRQLQNHSTQLARDILALFNNEFEHAVTSTNKSVTELADIMQQRVDSIIELNFNIVIPAQPNFAQLLALSQVNLFAPLMGAGAQQDDTPQLASPACGN